MKKIIYAFGFLILSFVMPSAEKVAFAVSTSVVINEVAWDGSLDSSSDEWIELYNNSTSSIDLSGWSIEDDVTTVYEIPSGSIAAKSYFVIEDAEGAVSTSLADLLVSLSLANGGDSLILKDSEGKIIDKVNSKGEKWPAGGGDGKPSMERIDPNESGDIAENWTKAISSNGGKASGGGQILGTPGSLNSVFEGDGSKVYFAIPNGVSPGSTIKVPVKVTSVEDLFAWSIEVNYDPTLIEFKSVSGGDFLGSDGIETYFLGALENGQEGRLIAGEARLVNPASGVDGGGTLFELELTIKENATLPIDLMFGGGSVLIGVESEIAIQFSNGKIDNIEGSESENTNVKNLTIKTAENRYEVALEWSGEGEKFLIQRANHLGEFVTLAEVGEMKYIDKMNLIPGVEYVYRVRPLGGSANNYLEEKFIETRGVRGDVDRSDRVDGKDLAKLARAYGSLFEDINYDPLLDVSYDGVINGEDLIIIGNNFGLIY